MKPHSALALLVVGIASGAAFVIACSDDSPSDADAAVCDCPAAEPPLADRIVFSSGQTSITAGGVGGNAYLCDIGSVALGGSCKLDVPDPNVHLVEAGRVVEDDGRVGYRCEWSSTSTTVRIGTFGVTCLVPAAQ